MAAEVLVAEKANLEKRLPVAMSAAGRGEEDEREQERTGDGAEAAPEVGDLGPMRIE